MSGPSGILATQPSCYRSQREAGESLGNPEGAIDRGSHPLSLHRRNQGPQMAKDLGHKAQCSPPQNSYVLGPEGPPPRQGSNPVSCTLRLSIGHSELRSPRGLQSRPEIQHYPLQASRSQAALWSTAPAWLDSHRPGTFLPSFLWACRSEKHSKLSISFPGAQFPMLHFNRDPGSGAVPLGAGSPRDLLVMGLSPTLSSQNLRGPEHGECEGYAVVKEAIPSCCLFLQASRNIVNPTFHDHPTDPGPFWQIRPYP